MDIRAEDMLVFGTLLDFDARWSVLGLLYHGPRRSGIQGYVDIRTVSNSCAYEDSRSQ